MVRVGIEDIREVGPNAPVLKVVGVGGGGGNAVNRMIAAGIRSVEFYVANTDLQDLKSSLAPNKLQLGSRCTRGLGAGAKPEIGREAALEDIETVREHLAGADMAFITAGLGGGTGTGAAPVVAEVARELGCLTVGVVTKPFKFEGKVRMRNGDEGILQLRKHVDTLIVIPNDNLLLLANKKTSIVEAFTMADDVLRVAIQGISDLINNEGLINLDFADVHTVMANMGQAIMGTGVGSGDNRAVEAAEKAIRSPLLDDCRIDGAKGILINVTGPTSLTLHEVNEAASFVEDHADDDANIIFGACIDETMAEDHIEVTVIATGFSGAPETSERDATAVRGDGTRMRSSYKVFSSSQDVGAVSRGTENGADGEEDDAGSSLPWSAPRTTAPQREVPAASEAPATPQAAAEPEETPLHTSNGLGAAPAEEPGGDGGESEEEVYELKDPIMEPVETRPQIPSSYRPEERRSAARGGGMDSDLDIPTFIRRRSKRFAEE